MKQKFDIDFDVRVIERNIRDNKITGKNYQKYLEKLEDLTHNAEPLVIEDDSTEEQSEEVQIDDTEDAADDKEGED